MTAALRTCLWFAGQAEKAARFYASLLPDSSIENVVRLQPDDPALVVEFTLAGAPCMALNGAATNDFTMATSLCFAPEGQAGTDHVWDALCDGGEPIQCGWLKDRFGVSWQIVPRPVVRMLSDSNRDAADRAHAAVLQMTRIDIDRVRQAFESA